MKKVNSRTFLMAIYYCLDSIPFGFFVAGLVFDILYMNTAEIVWIKAASCLIAFGLIFAIIPRLINLYLVWFTRTYQKSKISYISFWFYAFAIIAEIVNSFVHSRDAYGAIPEGVWLSIISVAFICIVYIAMAFDSNHKD